MRWVRGYRQACCRKCARTGADMSWATPTIMLRPGEERIARLGVCTIHGMEPADSHRLRGFQVMSLSSCGYSEEVFASVRTSTAANNSFAGAAMKSSICWLGHPDVLDECGAVSSASWRSRSLSSFDAVGEAIQRHIGPKCLLWIVQARLSTAATPPARIARIVSMLCDRGLPL